MGPTSAGCKLSAATNQRNTEIQNTSCSNRWPRLVSATARASASLAPSRAVVPSARRHRRAGRAVRDEVVPHLPRVGDGQLAAADAIAASDLAIPSSMRSVLPGPRLQPHLVQQPREVVTDEQVPGERIELSPRIMGLGLPVVERPQPAGLVAAQQCQAFEIRVATLPICTVVEYAVVEETSPDALCLDDQLTERSSAGAGSPPSVDLR